MPQSWYQQTAQSLVNKLLLIRLLLLLAGHAVAMVTYCAPKLTATCSPMIGQFVDTRIVALTDKEWL